MPAEGQGLNGCWLLFLSDFIEKKSEGPQTRQKTKTWLTCLVLATGAAVCGG